jgi:spoIIIJ-associated protein
MENNGGRGKIALMNNKVRNEEILKLACELLEMMNQPVSDAFVEDVVEEAAEGEEENKQVLVGLKVENPAHLIGFRGKNLAALQMVLAMMIKGKMGEWVRVVVDINNYRDEQKTRLATIVKNTAQKVLATQVPVALLPMSAFERRICHMTAAEIEGVISESEGEGEDRHIVIKPKA